MLADFVYAWRALRKAPLATTSAIGVLALAIAATVTVFSVTNALILRELPIEDPDQVVRVYRSSTSNSSYPDYEDYRDRNRTLSGLAAYQVVSLGLRSDGPPEHVYGEIVTGNFFEVLGLEPAAGRLIDGDDVRMPGAAPVIVLSYGFWQQRFGGKPSIIGESVRVNGLEFTVVGIAPKTYLSTLPPYKAGAWVPMTMDPLLRPGTDRLRDRAGALLNSVHVIGRLKPGVTLAQAREDLSAIARALEREYPDTHKDRTVSVRPARALHDALQGFFDLFFLVLFAVTGLGLMVACVNVSGLILARGALREREIAMRQALGATRVRIFRELLSESAILASAGALVGVLGAGWAIGVLETVPIPTPLPMALDLAVDRRVVLVTAMLVACATLVIGVVPAMGSSTHVVSAELRVEGGAAVARKVSRFRTSLVVLHVALSYTLLVGAGLFVRSLSTTTTADLGMRIDGVLTATVDLEARGYDAERSRRFYRELQARIEALPRVKSVSLVESIPLTLGTFSATLLPEGREPPPAESGQRRARVYTNVVSPGHFETLEIPIRAGRDFTTYDRADTPLAVIVNETLAHRFWPGQDPLGKRLRNWRANKPLDEAYEVIAVVGDSKYATVGEAPKAFAYRPIAQSELSGVSLLVRPWAGDPLELAGPIKDVAQTLDADLPVFDVRRLRTAASISLLPARSAGALLGFFGLVSLALASLGIYGLLTIIVAARQREIGIRMALGAQRRNVMAIVLGQALMWVVAGLGVGLVGAWLTTRFAVTLLYGVTPTDPATFVGVGAILLVVAVLGAHQPAQRATRLDPSEVLR